MPEVPLDPEVPDDPLVPAVPEVPESTAADCQDAFPLASEVKIYPAVAPDDIFIVVVDNVVADKTSFTVNPLTESI